MIKPAKDGGGGITDKESRKSAKLLRRAITERWAVPSHVMARAPEVCANLMVNAESERTALQAIGTLVAMVKCNVDIGKAEKEAEMVDHMLERFPTPDSKTHDAIRELHKRLGMANDGGHGS